MDAYALRHKTIATNLANITTPGYRAKTVAFEDQLVLRDADSCISRNGDA